MNIDVYDDLIPQDLQDVIHHYFMVNANVPWYFRSNLTDASKSDLSTPGLATSIYFNHGTKLPEAHSLTKCLIEFLPFKNKELISSRGFLQLPNGHEPIEANPHTDFDSSEPHIAVLYYVCDANGDTYFTDKTNEEIKQKDILNSDYNIIKRVSPKKGRLVVFDGSIYHGSSSTQFKPRCILNMDFKKYQY